MRNGSRYAIAGASVFVTALLCAGFFMRRAPAVAPEPFCPGGSHPDANVLACDGFEAGVTDDWIVSSGAKPWAPRGFVQCRDDGFGYQDRCAAWSNHLVHDTGWGFSGYDGWLSLPLQPEYYIRWYQYISNPYAWGTLEDKSVMLNDEAKTIFAYVATSRNQLPEVRDSGPGMPYVANYQDVVWDETGGQYARVNRFQNLRRNITLQPGRWYLFEWYIKLNTPGDSNGETKLWVDDAGVPIAAQTLRMHHTDMRWLRRSDEDKRFEFLRLTVYNQRCDAVPNTCPPNGPAVLDQSQRWDHLVISRKPIGPRRPPVQQTASANP
jgi:hypothetical protein